MVATAPVMTLGRWMAARIGPASAAIAKPHRICPPIAEGPQTKKRRNRIEIMFGRLKDWRRAATRYDRCPKGLPI